MFGNILEISKRSLKGGRVPITIALLKIHDDPKETNKNGLHWKEEYVNNALDSAKGIPICAEFCTETKDVPMGHGLTGVETNSEGLQEPVYENSETVGVITEANIENVNIDGNEIKALIGKGHLFSQRYPNFVKWVRTNKALGHVDTSIEIMGLAENNNKIIYLEDTPTSEFRTPKDFVFSGTAILSVEPADDNAVVVEVAEHNNKEENDMSEQEVMKIVQDAIKELDTAKADAEVRIAEVNSEMAEKDTKITELETQISEANSQIATKDAEIAELNTKIDELNKTIEESKKEKAINELNEVLKAYSEDEQKFAEAEINSYREDPINGSIDAVKAKICVGIVEKQKEDARIAEQNEAENKGNVEDIFAEVNSFEENEEEDVNIF